VEGLISEDIARLICESVSEKELQRVRRSTRRSILFPRESVLATAISLADDTALYNEPGRINAEPVKRLAVTATDIEKAAKTHLRKANRVVVVSQPAAAAPAQPGAARQN
jgi:predicted Zn-dependent peptidase